MKGTTGVAAAIAAVVSALITLGSCHREAPAVLPEERVPVTTMVVK